MSDAVTPFQAPVGTHDVLAPASAEWEGVVATFAQFAYRYGFELVITPMFEDVGVFNRGIGEESDVAKKEMYVFSDRGDRVYALRPEGTAPVVRAFIQHSPTTPWKAWYVTPAFRYERPQAGRYRQHHQLGVEVLGTDDPAVDVEVIALAERFYRALGLQRFRLLINSMGHDVCRAAYLELLRAHLEKNAVRLCDEHRTTWSENPLRVLDCKDPACIAVTAEGPFLIDHICEDCRIHFNKVVAGLTSIGIESHLDPRLVRGFDYYTRTTFEFVADALGGAQNAIGGGGRYDKLTEQLGGKPTSGIGFGSGIERLLLTREAESVEPRNLVDRSLDRKARAGPADPAIGPEPRLVGRDGEGPRPVIRDRIGSRQAPRRHVGLLIGPLRPQPIGSGIDDDLRVDPEDFSPPVGIGGEPVMMVAGMRRG